MMLKMAMFFKFRSDAQKYFKAVGGTITCPALGVIDPVTEITLNPSRDIFFKLDEGREFAYLAWKDADCIMGVSNDDGGTFMAHLLIIPWVFTLQML